MADRIDLDDFLGVLADAKRYSHYIVGVCPFPEHDDRLPSMLVFEDGRFLCLGCGKKGWHDEVYAAALAHPKMSSAKRTTILPPILSSDRDANCLLVSEAHDRLRKKPELGWYLHDRKVGSMIETAMLGWHEGWYTIPIWDQQAVLQKFQGLILRASPPIQNGSGFRFHQPPGQRPMLYVPDANLLRTNSTLFVVYGMFDALALASMRFAVVTTTGGKDSFDPEWVRSWRSSIIIVPDEGEEDTANKLSNHLDWRAAVLRIDYPAGCKDPADILQFKGPKALLHFIGKWASV